LQNKQQNPIIYTYSQRIGKETEKVNALKKLFVYLKGYARECVLGPLFKLL